MDGRRVAGALGALALGLVAGCAGAGRRLGAIGPEAGPLAAPGAPAGPAPHAANDLFAPQPKTGLARYFPYLNRAGHAEHVHDHPHEHGAALASAGPAPAPSPTVDARALAGPEGWERPGAPMPAPRPGLLGFLRGRPRGPAGPATAALPPGVGPGPGARLGAPEGGLEPGGGDPLAARGPAPGAAPAAEPSEVLPVSLVVEIDPASLPQSASERARAQMLAAAASRDAQARRARAGDDELRPDRDPADGDVPGAGDDSSAPAPLADPFADLALTPAEGPPPGPASAGGPDPGASGEAAASGPVAVASAEGPAPWIAPASAPAPDRPAAAEPAGEAGASATDPAGYVDPFAGLELEVPAGGTDLFAGRASASAPASSRLPARPGGPGAAPPRFAESTLPLSRRYVVPQAEPGDESEGPGPSGRPRMPLERPWRDGTTAALPPPDFPPSYGDPAGRRVPPPELGPGGEPARPARRFRLFGRLRDRDRQRDEAPGIRREVPPRPTFE
jgi:hypothetical protein